MEHSNLKLTDLIRPVKDKKKKKVIIISEEQAKRIFNIQIDEELKKTKGN
jgi:hypothetical protein